MTAVDPTSTVSMTILLPVFGLLWGSTISQGVALSWLSDRVGEHPLRYLVCDGYTHQKESTFSKEGTAGREDLCDSRQFLFGKNSIRWPGVLFRGMMYGNSRGKETKFVP